jgi:hypothetical protein
MIRRGLRIPKCSRVRNFETLRKLNPAPALFPFAQITIEPTRKLSIL